MTEGDSLTSGCTANIKAMLVRVPVATSQAVCGGHDMSASRMSLMALRCARGSFSGRGSRSVPSRPLSPWMSGACSIFRQNGLDAPGWMEMSSLPMACSTLWALLVVLINGALP